MPSCSRPRCTRSGAFELGGEDLGVVDGEQVRVLGFDVAPQCLDPGLVGGGVGPPEVLADGDQGHECPGLARAHLGAVVRHRQQDRGGLVIEVDVVGMVETPLQVREEPFGLEAGQEHDFDLTEVASAHNRVAIHLREWASLRCERSSSPHSSNTARISASSEASSP